MGANSLSNERNPDVCTDQMALEIIEDALSRLENGTYGICELCGGDMGVEHLIANPVSTVCEDCVAEDDCAK